MNAISKLFPSVYREWTTVNTRLEYEYRKEIPEGKVVEAVKAYIDSKFTEDKDEIARLWQELLKAIRNLDEGAIERIKQSQERYECRFGKVSLNVPETPKEVFGKEITGSA